MRNSAEKFSRRQGRSMSDTTTSLQAEQPAAEPCTVTVKASEALPMLLDAMLSHRVWLEDFEEDEITLPADMFDVLLAHRQLQQPAM